MTVISKSRQHLNTQQITKLDDDLIKKMVEIALEEDIQTGDVTAKLIDSEKQGNASVITRELMIVCGKAFVDEVFYQVDSNLKVKWYAKDGDRLNPNDTIFEVSGNAKSILTAERSAMNFLQMLSGVATKTSQFVSAIAHTKAKILDTRKTIPGFRLAQKYAVSCGGGLNHRIGLYDAYLIKENHIAACGSIALAVDKARRNHNQKLIEVEVESLAQLQEALDANCDVIMLDNFSLEMMKEAVNIVSREVALETSGNVNLQTASAIAETGVDYISVGGITKHIQAIDLSMRFI
ncbi:carboxylating nicotinate-nucleotide diphosphorylase [Thiotrichales bacterium 19S9-12]|nr:carboxylating nicotinate-nucleotide diphosphorylase [Thiotrichales bacterium 19S9-11]MCF6811333.1 carboxylating nicotinate-nucleotide diphosphorylase [Thiotrichales bacterium 19S9-12]